MDGQTAKSDEGVAQPVSFTVGGLSCAGCARSAERAISGVVGVGAAQVDFATERATVTLKDASATDVAAAVRDAGYVPAITEIELDITGMTCAHCAGTVEKALASVPGVVSASVNLAMERAHVGILGDAASSSSLVAAVKEAGYGAEPRATDAEVRRREAETRDAEAAARLRRETRILAFSALLSLPLLAMMVLPPLGVPYHLPAWAQFALALPVQFWIGARFYTGAYRSLRNGTGNMDVLVALGTTAAFALSTWMMIRDGIGTHAHLYYEAAAVVITLVLAGKILETRAKQGTTQAIRELMALRPERARVERDGNLVEIAIEQVRIGDIVVVRPGERIPVDGVVEEGATDVDEAMITGESVPVTKEIGDAVTGGSVNGTAEIRVAANRIGEDTTLVKIVRLVENAQAGKAPVQQLVDRISAVFVPAVVAVALVAFAGWMIAGAGFETAIINAVSVLVIACPCALGLATPTAIVAGTGAAAKAGILIRDVAVLEHMHALDTVAFDKTGTLTEGAPRLADIKVFAGDETEVLRIAASLQASSEHPLARAVVAAAEERGIDRSKARDVSAKVGSGIVGTVDGQRVAIGNRTLMEAEGVDLAGREDAVAAMEAAGRTVPLVAIDGSLAAALAIEDTLRAETPAAIAALKEMGLRTLMLSGDAKRVAAAIGERSGIDDVNAGLTPDAKVAKIEALRAEGRIVAMVGDGINDAPALAAADVGLAMGSGTDAAMETAGITLMRPDPRLVAAAVDAARATWRRIRWNLFWAFAFNTVGVPLAALGYLSPAVAGLAMALSSVTVVSNSLLLRGWRPRLEARS